MSTSPGDHPGRDESPDPSSHSANVYDFAEGELGEDGDDDMEFEPTTEDSEGLEFFDTTEDDDMEYHDAEDGLSGVEIELSMDDGDSATQGDGAGEETETDQQQDGPRQTTTRMRLEVSREQILQLFGHPQLRRIFARSNSRPTGARNRASDDHDDDDDDDELDGGYGGISTRRRRGPRARGCNVPKVPSDEGRKLMDSGIFGSNEYYQDALRKRKSRLASRLMQREMGVHEDRSTRCNKLMAQGLIPSSTADTIIHYDKRCYSGQFSEDGNFFFSCAQDFKVRMYDTSNPYDWKYYKTVEYPYGQWTITDASLSPDNKYLAYSSIKPVVCLAPTDPNEQGEPWLLDFSDMGRRGVGSRRGFSFGGGFGIWSIRFSGDGREIVAGTGNHCVYVYDIESRQSILRIQGHSEDVNAVCFGDQSSPHILYSGSDDTLIKVWDRRSMGDSREAGVFVGHTEGLTYVDSKGDGRYVLSNGKDQTMKLWDLRKMMSTEKVSELNIRPVSTGFDYRFMKYSEDDYQHHEHDCSLVTFRGHRVLKTLIRCHFSPPGSTDSRYVYSGSEDGSVHVYNMDATLAGKIDVKKATYRTRPRDPNIDRNTYLMDDPSSSRQWETCVRDASWHPNAPVIAATSWNGWASLTGTCTLHTWNDGAEEDDAEPGMGRRVDHHLKHSSAFYDHIRPRPTRTRPLRTGLRSQGVVAVGLNDDDDDDDENNGW